MVRRPPRVLRAAGLPVHDGVVRQWAIPLTGTMLTPPYVALPTLIYMGAPWPQDKYDLVTIDCARLSDDVQEAKQKWEKREEITGIRKLASNLKKHDSKTSSPR